MYIEDGKGSGMLAEVNDGNRLQTLSTTQNKLAYASEKTTKAFSAYGKRNFAAADTNENVFSLTYTGNGNFAYSKSCIFK